MLTLATVNPGGQTIAQVREFNRSNREYQVEILDFSAQLESSSYMDLFTIWNTAIVAGDTPDMIDFSNLPWHSFADRGLLLDLNTILPQEDILPWLWKSVSYNGGNYTFPGCFTVETLVGKQSKLGDRQHWTVQEFLDLSSSSDIPMFSGMSRSCSFSIWNSIFSMRFWMKKQKRAALTRRNSGRCWTMPPRWTNRRSWGLK